MSGARVLFVTHDGASHEPLGLEYVAGSLLAAGHQVRACMEGTALLEAQRWRPDFIAFQVITGDQNRWGAIALRLRDVVPAQTKMVFGGPHFLFFSKSEQDVADIVLRGEAEASIVDAVEGREWADFVATPDLDTLPFPHRELFYNHRFKGIRDNVIRNSIACRGCPYKCSYCYNSNEKWLEMVRGQKRLRYHSPEYLAAETRKTFDEHGGELVSFQDDIFGVDMDWLERFASVWKRDVGLPFFAQLRPALITEDRVRLLKEAGVHIVSFAIESGNEETRRIVLDRHEPNDLILKGANILHRHGLRFRMQNMLGLPVENPLGDALETLRSNMKARPTLSWCSLLQAYPGTKIADYVVKQGLVESLEALMPMVDADFFGDTSLPIDGKREIKRLHKYWSAVVRWPWMYPIVRALIHLPMPDVVLDAVFEKTKQHINKHDYWQVRGRDVPWGRGQPMDRLGAEAA